MSQPRARRFPALSSTPLGHLTPPKLVCIGVTVCSCAVIGVRIAARGSL